MKTLLLSLSIIAIIDTKHDASDIKTASVGINAVAKACKAFNGVNADSKRVTFAAIAGVARVTEADAVMLCGMTDKGSQLRDALKALRRGIVTRVCAASVVHDAASDAADVVCIDRMVSNLDLIAKHASSLVCSVAVAA